MTVDVRNNIHDLLGRFAGKVPTASNSVLTALTPVDTTAPQFDGFTYQGIHFVDEFSLLEHIEDTTGGYRPENLQEVMENLTHRYGGAAATNSYVFPLAGAGIDPEQVPASDALYGAVGWDYESQPVDHDEVVGNLTRNHPDEAHRVNSDGLHRTTEQFIVAMAVELGIDLTDQSSYDVDDFPKPIASEAVGAADLPALRLPYFSVDHGPETGEYEELNPTAHTLQDWVDKYDDEIGDFGQRGQLLDGVNWHEDPIHCLETIRENAAKHNIDLDALGVELPKPHNFWRTPNGFLATAQDALDEWVNNAEFPEYGDANLSDVLWDGTDYARRDMGWNIRQIRFNAKNLGIDLDSFGTKFPQEV
ncbi:hypothetical protein [Leifsonia sp. Leaf264]|uniref:hypothetical protein n=1 Tax=Leifsonia sp. Leaf264 TaxID=1736314 RepID=UPI0006FD1C99|nr:hypothetical protein [Leifsonia sp. Leaf264]KQO98631.1 hypothetical protein ASF30_11250 [Leifsonia sp. Leaf264]